MGLVPLCSLFGDGNRKEASNKMLASLVFTLDFLVSSRIVNNSQTMGTI